ncbi:hypothetical protein [Niabella hibiscisoli]|uniref:hypothetical protein n=1 Tax=Niabella hibiscisoli TaxID=1825928 RepID=UPI001F0F8EA9|nr:hypothetical protein [Niabella hibiscisoli]MCH5716209.1 hypothetical protein [Niabella hibiscisoli]
MKVNPHDDHWKTRLLMKQNRKKEIIKAGQLLVKAIANKEEIDEQLFMEMMDITNDPDEQEPGENKAEATVQQVALKKNTLSVRKRKMLRPLFGYKMQDLFCCTPSCRFYLIGYR